MAGPSGKSHLRAYWLVWGALLVLTGVTYASAKIHLGDFNLLVALLIASVKGSLVVVFFMHLKDHGPTNRAYFLLSVVFIALLAGLSVADLATRAKMTNPNFPALPWRD